MPDQVRCETQRELCILDPALAAVTPERVSFFAPECAARRQRGVPVHLAGNACEQRPTPQRVIAQAFDAMRPVTLAAEHPEHHNPCLAKRALDI